MKTFTELKTGDVFRCKPYIPGQEQGHGPYQKTKPGYARNDMGIEVPMDGNEEVVPAMDAIKLFNKQESSVMVTRQLKIKGLDGEIVYSGFNRQLDDAKYICVVQVEDSTEVYALDSDSIPQSLCEYLEEFCGQFRIIGVFEKNYAV